MTTQLVLVALLVLAATAYLLWQMYRAWIGSKPGCGGGCSCPSKAQKPAQPALITTDELLARLRR